MDVFVVDDSRQERPTRKGMGSLVATGALRVPNSTYLQTERDLEAVCGKAGFPDDEPFKWSPSPGMWMRKGLVGEDRAAFFENVLASLLQNGTRAVLVIADASKRRATGAATAELDVTNLLIERIENWLTVSGGDGLVLADRPPGNQKDQEEFLSDCLETIQGGTGYVKPRRIAAGPVTSASRRLRLLQAADLVTSATLSFVAGEDQFSPRIFAAVRPLLRTQDGRVGGTGIKIHPDFLYMNLYHWLLRDDEYRAGVKSFDLPLPDRPYANGPDVP